MKMIKLALCGLILCVSHYSLASTTKTQQAIEDVIEQFKNAIFEKDETAFLRLFHSGDVSWVGVISEETIDMLVSKDPRYAQQPRIMPGTPKSFIEGVMSTDVVSREEANNIQIIADENVASVMFDYRLYKDDKLNNWGKENWQLINTPDGWKINAVNFSYVMNPALLELGQ